MSCASAVRRGLPEGRMTADLANAADHMRRMELLLRAVQELSLARSLPEIQAIVRTSAA